MVTDASPQVSRIRAGLAAYAARHRLAWRQLFIEPSEWASRRRVLDDERPRAVVGMLRDQSECLRWATERDLWVVSCSDDPGPGPRTCTVAVDDDAIGRIAARHFAELGYRHVACISGRRDAAVRRNRYDAFIRQAEALGLSTRWYRRPPDTGPGPAVASRERHLADWLRCQPQPLGVFLHQDRSAYWFGDFCRHHGFCVPDEIAILGADNDTYTCERQDPPLSSVVIPWYVVGQEMGLALHRALSSGHPPPPTTVAPYRVQERASTRRPESADALVAKAMRLATHSPRRPPAVAALARELGVSRATLHRRFVATIGQPPGRWLLRERIRRAQELLLAGDEPVAAIAARCGFASRVRFSAAFKSVTGSTPSRFREAGGGV